MCDSLLAGIDCVKSTVVSGYFVAKDVCASLATCLFLNER